MAMKWGEGGGKGNRGEMEDFRAQEKLNGYLHHDSHTVVGISGK